MLRGDRAEPEVECRDLGVRPAQSIVRRMLGRWFGGCEEDFHHAHAARDEIGLLVSELVNSEF
jgi:hypothetical protein